MDVRVGLGFINLQEGHTKRVILLPQITNADGHLRAAFGLANRHKGMARVGYINQNGARARVCQNSTSEGNREVYQHGTTTARWSPHSSDNQTTNPYKMRMQNHNRETRKYANTLFQETQQRFPEACDPKNFAKSIGHLN